MTLKNETKTQSWLMREIKETQELLASVPSTVVTLMVVSVICMNLLANKTIFQNEWLALDGGFLMSWLAFMCMDAITIHFGPKAGNRIVVFALLVNLFACLFFYIVSIIPSTADDYTAFNTIFKGTWFILLGSSIAFVLSGFINNFLNWTIGKMFKDNPDSKMAYATRTYISTFIGQFIDNLIFAVIVFTIFAPIFWDGFHWTIIQCITCSLTGAIAELIMEVLFSPIGYHTALSWKQNKIGETYINKYVKE